MEQINKKCSRCRETKPFSEFGKGADRQGLNYYCKDCYPAIQRQKYQNRKESHKAYQTDYVKNHRAMATEASRKWYFREVYGITPQEYEEMAEAQGGLCRVCGMAPKKLYVDHCHESGKVRGLLCSACNLGLGHFGDNLDSLAKAIQYLKGE